MPATDAASVATNCLKAWSTGDFDTARALLHDDVTFIGPLATGEGIDDCVGGLHGLKEIVKAAEVRQVIADGDDVCVGYDLVTNTGAGAVATAGWYHVRSGKIDAIRAYFDPRPLLRD